MGRVGTFEDRKFTGVYIVVVMCTSGESGYIGTLKTNRSMFCGGAFWAGGNTQYTGG